MDFIVIACNTAYYFCDKFQETIDVPILDLKKAVKNYLKNKKIESITILGSSITINSNLFNLDIKQNNLSKDEINVLDELIENYLARGEKKRIENFKKLVKKYSRKSQLILSACTEISLLMKEEKIDFINTMNILVEATVNKWKQTK